MHILSTYPAAGGAAGRAYFLIPGNELAAVCAGVHEAKYAASTSRCCARSLVLGGISKTIARGQSDSNTMSHALFTWRLNAEQGTQPPWIRHITKLGSAFLISLHWH
jgi:hypothetical protein